MARLRVELNLILLYPPHPLSTPQISSNRRRLIRYWLFLKHLRPSHRRGIPLPLPTHPSMRSTESMDYHGGSSIPTTSTPNESGRMLPMPTVGKECIQTSSGVDWRLRGHSALLRRIRPGRLVAGRGRAL
ncbi:hypothetical protein DL93DRAFT_2080619 [Clavulina sp. PMI_390]|nr:hypothetical protein DL93DRAFT_2080619 [Clavulina sp. PMI_390]